MKFLFPRPGLLIPATLLLMLGACKKTATNNNGGGGGGTGGTKHATGWSGTDDPTKVPQAVNLVGITGSAAALPSSVDLTPYLPPIGDQGQTGTCVAWSTAYYTKTA